MKKKKYAAFFLTLIMTVAFPTVARAEVVTVQPAKDSSEAKLNWSVKIGGGWDTLSEIKMVGSYIYAADNHSQRIVKIDKKTGKIVKETKYSESMYYIADLGYGDGKIFVGYDSGKIQAFDAQTLKSLWISESADHEISSRLLYSDGELYVGTGGPSSPGSYYRITTKDDDPSKENEEKSITKITTSKSGNFYWNQGVVLGNYLLISDSAGNLMSFDRTRGYRQAGSKKLLGNFSGGIACNRTSNTIYLADQSANFYGIKVKQDGTMETVSTISLKNGGYVAGSPEYADGKVYISGRVGDYGSKGFLSVVNVASNQYKISSMIELPENSQSVPIVAKSNVYITVNTMPGGLYAVNTAKDGTSARLHTVYEPTSDETKNYCMSTPAVDEDGTLFYTNDSKYLFAVGKKNTASVQKPITYKKSSVRKIKLSWKKKKKAKGYVIYVKAGKGKYKRLTTVGKVSSKTITVRSGASYKFKVKPYRNGTKGRKYYKVRQVKAKNGKKTVKVKYGNVAGYESYQLEVKRGRGNYRRVKSYQKGGTITYTLRNARVGTSYQFRLKGSKTVKGKKNYVLLKVKNV